MAEKGNDLPQAMPPVGLATAAAAAASDYTELFPTQPAAAAAITAVVAGRPDSVYVARTPPSDAGLLQTPPATTPASADHADLQPAPPALHDAPERLATTTDGHGMAPGVWRIPIDSIPEHGLAPPEDAGVPAYGGQASVMDVVRSVQSNSDLLARNLDHASMAQTQAVQPFPTLPARRNSGPGPREEMLGWKKPQDIVSIYEPVGSLQRQWQKAAAAVGHPTGPATHTHAARPLQANSEPGGSPLGSPTPPLRGSAETGHGWFGKVSSL